ncbi:MAG: shikimate kinase [Pseudomonadales bacterium]|jgi:shikimate kinase|nr:shikimate kinase [Pseudomonadales bacterium]MCP5320646.1 shikimate kinase [Pseudomonadales bacterium]MCP5336609.1 shikimate kinase [Pseudomonadales bacterium]
MSEQQRGITLIGMPGCGKSTVGRLLAARLGLEFVDTDRVIEACTGRRLQQIIDGEGAASLRTIEQDVLGRVDAHARVVATGGSAVYADAAMRHLATASTIVHLDVGLPELEQRVTDWATRGLVRTPGQDMAELLTERSQLYRRHADIRVTCDGLTPEQVVEHVIAALLSHGDSAVERTAASPP